MVRLSILLLLLPVSVEARSARTVRLADGEMEQVFVEPGFSTLLKFKSRPEPGVIGDQDGFKVEYMKNIVAIKPLLPRGKTNLFVFTKEGQFNFQLVVGHGNHDNVVYVEPRLELSKSPNPKSMVAASIDDLSSRKINKTVEIRGFKLTLESIAEPKARTTLVLKFSLKQESPIQGRDCKPPVQEAESSWFSVVQGGKPVPVENIFLERVTNNACAKGASGYILLRGGLFSRSKPMKLILTLPARSTEKQAPLPIELSFIPEIRR